MRLSRSWLWLILLVLVPLVAWWKANPTARRAVPCAFETRQDPAELRYVDHARCRMACREVSQEWVEKVYEKGKVNCAKSGPVKGDMRWALEMRDDQGDDLRVIIEDEEGEHIVITVIRLGRPDQCRCS